MTEAAETVFVQFTETAIAQPSETPIPPTQTAIPSETPTVTLTPIPTRTVVWIPTYYYSSTPKTPSATATNSSWSCSITFQLVASNTEFGAYEDFDARWTVKNTGSETWESSDVDYRYMSGTEMQKYDTLYDLPETVAPGDTVSITVDMKAPSTSGYYETNWGLVRHTDSFCNLPTRIRVK
jgi:hypothetical protein